MSSQVELAPPAVDRVPPVRHLFVGWAPPATGDVAVCGHTFVDPRDMTHDGSITGDCCVVCVELARARGYQL